MLNNPAICASSFSAAAVAAAMPPTAGGPQFADGGFFRAKFGVCNIADPGDTYAVIWQPKKPPLRSVPVLPAPGRTGCYTYQVRSSEPYLSKVAEVFGVPLRQLLLDNTDRVKTLDESPVGKRLVICNPDPDAVQLVLPGGTQVGRGPGPAADGAPAPGRSTSQPMRIVSQPQSAPGSRVQPAPSGTDGSTALQPAGTTPAQPSGGGEGGGDGSTPPPVTPTPAATETQVAPPQQQQQQPVGVVPSPSTIQLQTAVRTRQGCTCSFYSQSYPGVGRCNWYTVGEPAPWCYTDLSNGPCGQQSLMSVFGGDIRWDYTVGQLPPRACTGSR
jgi:hypothetical protein